MKRYLKYLGIIVLLALEIVSVNKLSSFGLENLFALWGGLYFILLYRLFVNFTRSPGVNHTAGGSISGVLHKSARLMIKTGEIEELKEHSKLALKNIELKLIYLTLFLVHIGLSYYFLKLPS